MNRLTDKALDAAGGGAWEDSHSCATEASWSSRAWSPEGGSSRCWRSYVGFPRASVAIEVVREKPAALDGHG